MTKEQLKALVSLTNDGYAVIVWTPDEIGDISPRHIVDRSIELGHRIIEDLTMSNEP